MIQFDKRFITELTQYTKTRQPDFGNLKKVLTREKPERFTLFEFFLNETLYRGLAGYEPPPGIPDYYRMRIKAFRAAGYDYCTVQASEFGFPNRQSTHGKSSRSMTDGASITSREEFERYPWMEPEKVDNSLLEQLSPDIPEGMKLIVCGPMGVLENAMALIGYENLCYLLADDPDLVGEIFNNIGSRLLRYYKLVLEHDCVGACILNDDWGFATQTMLSPEDMRKYVFPWHKKIVEVVHGAGRPAILHSCGQMSEVYEDIIEDIKFDGKHSYEEKIEPIEEAYEKLYPRIAVMGGLDLDFICRSTPEEVYNKACKVLELTEKRGGYALGTGNSVPEYVPADNYFAMICAAIINS